MPEIKRKDYERAKENSEIAVLELVADACVNMIGGKLTADNFQRLNVNQISLITYCRVRQELLQGGFIQLIYNGLGPFVFKNPFAKVMKLWGVGDLGKIVYDAHRLYSKYHNQIEIDCSDEEFMSLYEKYEAFDKYDDEFVEREPEFTSEIEGYVEKTLNENFAAIVD